MAQFAAGLRPTRRQLQIIREQLRRGIEGAREMPTKIIKGSAGDGNQH